MTRLEITKTYKIYIGGKFPRTESGRYYSPKNKDGKPIGNICLSSRKDFREAVVAARSACAGWSKASPFNRSQVLYRIAEMLETRKSQFEEEIIMQGASKNEAAKETSAAIDRIIYFAGWCDKFQQVFSSVNPVSSPHFNFSVPEPTGVVAVIAPQSSSLLGLMNALMPVMAGGNTSVVIASERLPLCAVTFAEVLHTSDVPGGVVNILTGKSKELVPQAASHMDVNAVVYYGTDETVIQSIRETSAVNVKRPVIYPDEDIYGAGNLSPYRIMDTQEIKTTWHPIEDIG